MSARKQNMTVNDGVSWIVKFGISAGFDDMEAQVLGANGKEIVKATWLGSGALTLTNYNGFPIGSTIVDTQAFKIHMKTSATAWKSSAAMT